MVRRWRMLISSLAVIIAGAGLVVVGPAQPAAAAAGRGTAFVWNYNESYALNTWYTPVGDYQYNSTSPGAPNNQVIRTGVGTYDVKIPGMVGFGATQVTAYGWDAVVCTAGDTVASTYALVDVTCAKANGTLVDHSFTLSFTNLTSVPAGTQLAYMEVESDGAIWSNRHFNSGGAISTTTRQGSTYVVRIPGLGSYNGHVQVTSAVPWARCKVRAWYPTGADQQVFVNCWHAGGFNVPENAPFILTYTNQQSILGEPGHQSAYAWANQPTTQQYTPSSYYQYSTSGYAPTAYRSGTGLYVMTFTNVNMNNGNVQVTAYGSGQEFCGINYWYGNNVQVQCYDYSGAPADSYYTVAFTGL